MHNNITNDIFAMNKEIAADLKKLVNKIDNMNRYYVSTGVGDSIGDTDEIGNGVTGSELKAAITSHVAIPSFIETNFHWSNILKLGL